MRHDPLEALARAAAETAMHGAADWLRARGAATTCDTAVLVAAIRAKLKERLASALADAREALDAGLPGAAESGFLADMRLAGIDAARETAETRRAEPLTAE